MTNPLARDLEHVLEHTGDVWPHLQGARIFVTGGTGFFGCWLLESFAWASDRLQLDASLTVLTRSPEAFRRKAPHLASHPAIHLVHGDIRSFPFPAGHFSHVIHGASEASRTLNQEQPLPMLDTIVNGTRRALDFAATAEARRFLLISSGAVYGPQPPVMARLPETYGGGPDPIEPRSVYGEGKRLAELLCALYSRDHGLDCLVVRGFAFVGPHLPLDVHFAIGNFIGDCLKRRPLEIRGDGTPYRSYLYAADLAIWLWTILVRGESCRPYNVGSERGLSIAELAAMVVAALEPVLEPTIAMRVRGLPRPGAAPERYVPDTSRARLELGLRELVTLEDAIRRTAEWHTPAAVSNRMMHAESEGGARGYGYPKPAKSSVEQLLVLRRREARQEAHEAGHHGKDLR
ncbi:MAG: NAD-dependent epimerase/dehydratase family protein [Acidobacteriia bacterium]|nr:NAD-dependent epimerase/dehydratase family protein [Terriglobia bacterium]